MLIFGQDTEVDLAVCEDILPEERREIWEPPLGLQTLECSLDVSGIDIAQEIGFLDDWQRFLFNILPWWPPTEFLPIPCILTSLSAFLFTEMLEQPSKGF